MLICGEKVITRIKKLLNINSNLSYEKFYSATSNTTTVFYTLKYNFIDF